MIFQDLHITNFRGIRELHITDPFAQINVLVGKNNCGKSSVLEAMYLLSSTDAAREIIHSWNFNSVDKRNLNSFFYNMDTDIPISLRSKLSLEHTILNFKEDHLKLDISVYNKRANSDSTKEIVVDLGEKIDNNIIFIYNTKAKLRVNDKHNSKLKSSTVYSGNKISFKSYFWGHHSLFTNDKFKILGEAITFKQIPNLVKVLSSIDPTIQNIQFGADNLVLIDTGLNTLMPLSYFGDGVKRALFILAAISSCKDGVLFIDEVDTGLHHTSLKVFLEAMVLGAREFNVQVFVSTHSDECVEILRDVIIAQNENQNITEESVNDFAVYRIEKNKDTAKESHDAIYFGGEQFDRFLERNWEYR